MGMDEERRSTLQREAADFWSHQDHYGSIPPNGSPLGNFLHNQQYRAETGPGVPPEVQYRADIAGLSEHLRRAPDGQVHLARGVQKAGGPWRPAVANGADEASQRKPQADVTSAQEHPRPTEAVEPESANEKYQAELVEEARDFWSAPENYGLMPQPGTRLGDYFHTGQYGARAGLSSDMQYQVQLGGLEEHMVFTPEGVRLDPGPRIDSGVYRDSGNQPQGFVMPNGDSHPPGPAVSASPSENSGPLLDPGAMSWAGNPRARAVRQLQPVQYQPVTWAPRAGLHPGGRPGTRSPLVPDGSKPRFSPLPSQPPSHARTGPGPAKRRKT